MTTYARANDLHNALNANNIAFFFTTEFIDEMSFMIEFINDDNNEDKGTVNDAFLSASLFIDKKIDDMWDTDDNAKRLNIALTMAFNMASLSVIEFIRDNHYDIAMALKPIANRCINSTLFSNDDKPRHAAYDEDSFKLHDDNCECELCINNEWSNSNRAKAGMK